MRRHVGVADYTVTYLNPNELLVCCYQFEEIEGGYEFLKETGVHFLSYVEIWSRDINYLGTIYARILPQDLPQ